MIFCGFRDIQNPIRGTGDQDHRIEHDWEMDRVDCTDRLAELGLQYIVEIGSVHLETLMNLSESMDHHGNYRSPAINQSLWQR